MNRSTKGYIAKKKPGTSLYENLHQEALELLQKLSGATWTDYNEHDPGVTLLENIAYAMTEVAYKIALPIEDILHSSKGAALASGDNGLFEAADILTTSPVTFEDYRKLWIDEIPNIKNVWIYPVDSYEKELANIKGLLHVYVEKYEYHANRKNEQRENEEIKQQMRSLYQANRNLCEDLYAIEVYKPLSLVMDFHITLSDLVEGEEVLASIIHKINDYLAPEVTYRSLGQMQEQGHAVNTIFNGPSLNNGFIEDVSLKDPKNYINIPEIIKLISRIRGVVNISDFSLSFLDPVAKKQHVIRESLRIPKNMTARVLFPKTNEQLVFENSGVVFYPDLVQTKKQLSFIQALDASKFKAASHADNTIDIPTGSALDIEEYFPIRKQLPELYGVGDHGISQGASPLRQAQVQQLKAYLLPFDQLLVNFLAQLNKLYTLYDVRTEDKQTYFTNTLPDVAELTELLMPQTTDMELEELERYWSVVTHELMRYFDRHASSRLHAIADQLLARYSEVFQGYALEKINKASYLGLIPEETYKNQILKSKRQLVAEYGTLSYQRAKSFDYTAIKTALGDQEQRCLAGVFKKIAIATGIESLEIKSFTKTVMDAGIHLHAPTEELALKISEITIDTPLGQVEIDEVSVQFTHVELQRELREGMHFVGGDEGVLSTVLKEGINVENYSIQPHPHKEGAYLVLHRSRVGAYHVVHIATSKEAAVSAVHQAVAYLLELNKRSEGFWIVEHLWLLPDFKAETFGFCIDFSKIVASFDLVLNQYKKMNFATRDEQISKLLHGIQEGTVQFEGLKREGGYACLVLDEGGEELAISENVYPSVPALEEAIGGLARVLKSTTVETVEELTTCYVYYGDEKVDETFFSFTMSWVLPAWPVRFQNDNFRKVFEHTVYESLPIHIVSEFHWLTFERLQAFEELYFQWSDLFQLQSEDPSVIEARNFYAFELIKMLQMFA
ncbi:conserved hypothetical protein [Tenacibaculum litopenaei]|uniref:hypothetical protein n=1 Tax=Tenacibaculum litopenaei TaxID=396016 RepID=UPI0038960E42